MLQKTEQSLLTHPTLPKPDPKRESHHNETGEVLAGVQLINPKSYAVNTPLFSGFHFLPADPLAEILIKFAIIAVIWVPVHLAWLWAGVSLKRMDLSPATLSIINKLMALSLVAVIVLAAVQGTG
jgi:threonine/homoserine/homoserine lactone efflux protein